MTILNKNIWLPILTYSNGLLCTTMYITYIMTAPFLVVLGTIKQETRQCTMTKDHFLSCRNIGLHQSGDPVDVILNTILLAKPLWPPLDLHAHRVLTYLLISMCGGHYSYSKAFLTDAHTEQCFLQKPHSSPLFRRTRRKSSS